MKPKRLLDQQPNTPVCRPLRFLIMLLLSVGLVVTGPVSAALAVTTTPVVQVSGEDAETYDDSEHNERLADTGAQRILLLTLSGLLSVGGGLTAWWVSRHSKLTR